MYEPEFEKINILSKEQLLKEIKFYKRKIKKLKKIIEHPDYAKKIKVCPSEKTILSCDRDYLQMAKFRYIFLGGDYKYDKEEIKDKTFNEKLKDITKITFCKGGFYALQMGVTVDLTNDQVKINYFNDCESFVKKEKSRNKLAFLKNLAQLHIGEWRSRYNCEQYGVSVMDGEEWELKIEYKNFKTKVYEGASAYPYNFKEFLGLIGLI